MFPLRSQIGAALTGPVKRWTIGPSGAEGEYWQHVAEEALEQLPPDAAERAEALLGGGLVGELAPIFARRRTPQGVGLATTLSDHALGLCPPPAVEQGFARDA